MLRVPVKRLAHGADLELPTHATMDSAGMDLRAAVEADITLPPGGRSLIPTGIALALPSGYEGQVRPRSSLALKHGVAVLNSPGTVDADYRGELSVLLINHGDEPFIVRRGERIAVCQKNFQIYTRPPYQDQVVAIEPATPVAESAATPFDCRQGSVRTPAETKAAADPLTILPGEDCCGPNDCC